MILKKGIQVKIISGKDKGKTGKIVKMIHKKNKAIVTDINKVKKNQKPDNNQPGGIIDKEMPVIAICTKSDEYDKMISNIREVGSRNAIVIGIIDKENEHVKDYLDYSITVPSTSKDFTPIINQIPLQLLAYHCAVFRGCDVDKPRNLAKSVTVE